MMRFYEVMDIKAQIRPFSDPATDDLYVRIMADLQRYKTPGSAVRWQVVRQPDTAQRRTRWSKVA